MKRQFLAFMAIAAIGLASCEKNNPDTQDDSKVSCVKEVYCATKGNTISYFNNPVTKNTFVCSWTGGVDGTYVPYLQKITSNGKVAWNNWTRIQNEPGLNHINETLHFAVTPNDETIHIFNVKKEINGAREENIPYINKVSADGELMWGETGVEFYKFQEIYVEAIEGYVISDNKGGAWIAASNGRKEMVVRHVDGNGNLGKIYSFQPVARESIRRPQLILSPNGDVMVVTENFDIISHQGGSELIYSADFRLSIIKPDGTLNDKGALIENQKVFPGNLPSICPAADGYYAVLRTSDGKKSHLIAQHLTWDGTPLTAVVDLTPKGMDTEEIERVCVDKDNNMVVVILGIQGSSEAQYGAVTVNVVSPDGGLKFGDKGKVIYKTTPDYLVYPFGVYLMQKEDDTFFFSYSQTTSKVPITYSMWGMKFDLDGNVLSNESLLPLESVHYLGPTNNNGLPYFDGVLRMFFIDDNKDQLFGLKFTL